MILEANRTWAIYVGVSSSVDLELEILQYVQDQVIITAHNNFTDLCPSAWLSAPGILYINKDPGGLCNPCVGNLLNETYGNITAEFLVQYPAPSAQTGDTLLAVYDYKAMYTYVAWSQNGSPAYSNQILAINIGALFSLTAEI